MGSTNLIVGIAGWWPSLTWFWFWRIFQLGNKMIKIGATFLAWYLHEQQIASFTSKKLTLCRVWGPGYFVKSRNNVKSEMTAVIFLW